jgi:hypothetical protein
MDFLLHGTAAAHQMVAAVALAVPAVLEVPTVKTHGVDPVKILTINTVANLAVEVEVQVQPGPLVPETAALGQLG